MDRQCETRDNVIESSVRYDNPTRPLQQLSSLLLLDPLSIGLIPAENAHAVRKNNSGDVGERVTTIAAKSMRV